MSKNYLTDGIVSSKDIQNELPEELIAIFGDSDIETRLITTNVQHSLSGEENLILVSSNCIIKLPRAMLYKGELAIKLNAMVTVVVGVNVNDSGATIDDHVTITLNTVGITVLGSDTKNWHIIQYR